MLDDRVCVTILIIISMYIGYKFFSKILLPIIIDKNTKDIETNPSWITPKLREQYYGFHDMDIILVEDPFNHLPRFRIEKNKQQLQFLISNDTSIKDIDDVARIALAGKIKIKYGFWYPDKPAYWLSVLLYMLDGGDIQEKACSWEKVENTNIKKDNKPIDL